MTAVEFAAWLVFGLFAAIGLAVTFDWIAQALEAWENEDRNDRTDR